ncbi:MAG: peptidoglycan-binding protein [bacterium]|nr:peptidoglycan-binding protein [bacterium]
MIHLGSETTEKSLNTKKLPTLTIGDNNDNVSLLQKELVTAGFPPAIVTKGCFDTSTAVAVSDFQASRGLSVDGICGPHTWTALQEASWTLGDRDLAIANPALRGDDVAELQLRLGSLGFDAGRVDGIFGSETASAVKEFQFNSGLHPDGICSTETTACLKRMSARVIPATVAAVRERAMLQRAPKKLTEKHIMIVFPEDLAAVGSELCTGLRRAGAAVHEISDLSESDAANEANRLKVDVCLNLVPSCIQECRISYFATEGFVSPGGKRLASILGKRLPVALSIETSEVRGMRLPILRHTQMTAVQCSLGPLLLIQARLAPVARAFEAGLALWATKPA